MTDEQIDPWKMLASELGVDPAKEPPPPPVPDEPAGRANVSRPPAASPPPPSPKKMSSDWMALAGELGIEVPPEPDKRIVGGRDPVADLLGFPAESARPPEET